MASLADAAGVTSMPRSEEFWAWSAGFVERRRASVRQYAGRETQGMSREFVRKEQRWERRAKSYLSGGYESLLRAGMDSVRADPEIARSVVRLMNGIAPALQRAFDAHLPALAFKAVREWPFDTGLSASLLSLEYDVNEAGDTFTGRFASRAGYTVFIEGQPHRRLIDTPGREVSARIAADALDDIARGG